MGHLDPATPLVAGSWPLLWSALIAGENFYLSFIRPRRHQHRHNSSHGYRHASGIPIVGSLGLIAAPWMGWGAPGTAIIGLILSFVDTGSPPWFLVMTWRDRPFWDEPRRHDT